MEAALEVWVKDCGFGTPQCGFLFHTKESHSSQSSIKGTVSEISRQYLVGELRVQSIWRPNIISGKLTDSFKTIKIKSVNESMGFCFWHKKLVMCIFMPSYVLRIIILLSMIRVRANI